MLTNFMAIFGFMRSFGRTSFENGLQYRHYDIQWQYISYTLSNMMKIGPVTRDYQGTNAPFWM